MNTQVYKSFLVEEATDKTFASKVVEKKISDLPKHDVLIRVCYSSLNYKDALSATGNKGVTRKYPHTPGIDAAGIVQESNDPEFKSGDQVVVIGNDLGMNTPGGFGQYIRVPADWVVHLPAELTLKESMIIGTAGFTAAWCVIKIADEIKPEGGPILVTGATGGVGTLACRFLNDLGYEINVVSGSTSAKDWLKAFNVTEIIERSAFSQPKMPPMLSSKFAGVVDTVGGEILVNAIKSTNIGGVVSACGNAGGVDLNLTVFPFILRGISLHGISSQNCSHGVRKKLWHRIARDFKISEDAPLYEMIKLDQLSDRIDKILKGDISGRVVVDLE